MILGSCASTTMVWSAVAPPNMDNTAKPRQSILWVHIISELLFLMCFVACEGGIGCWRDGKEASEF